jgi:hypothetical protein
LPAGLVGAAYLLTFSATGGVEPFAWLADGTLPDGLALDPVAGTLSGTPTQAGSFQLSVFAIDAQGCSGARAYSLAIGPVSDLTVTIVDSPDPVAPGGQLTYVVNVADLGPDAAEGVGLAVALPADVGIESATTTHGTCDIAPGTVTCNIGALAAGPGATVTVIVTAPATSGSITAGASVHGEVLDPSPANDTATATTSVGALEPDGLALDTMALSGTSSNLNGILEPGEDAVASPSWHNPTTGGVAVAGIASGLGGPAGAIYSLTDTTSSYGTIPAGGTGSCAGSGDCIRLMIDAPSGRPATHWDAAFTETLDSGQVWTWPVHIGASFADVPVAASPTSFYALIERLLHSGTTVGCAPAAYCPANQVTRALMAMFLARALRGGSDAAVPAGGTVPGRGTYACGTAGTSLFVDVAPVAQYCRHVHLIAAQGITLGCNTGGEFCPNDLVSRKAMALFVARAIAGSDPAVPMTYDDPVTLRAYSCDPAQPNLHFADVTVEDMYCRHVHYLWARAVVDGYTPTTYGPNLMVRRDQMAKFLVNAFGF